MSKKLKIFENLENSKNFQSNSIKEFHILDFPDTVYVKIKDNFRKRLFNQVYNKFVSKRKTAKSSSIDLKTLLRYEKGFSITKGIKYPQSIPIKFLRKVIDSKNQLDLEKNISAISARVGLKVHNLKLPIKESPELYSIIGHMIGDGSASKGKTPYYANTCKKLRKQFKNNLQIFGKVNPYERIPNTTPVVNFPKVVTDVLAHIFNINFTYPNKIPEQLFKTTKECKKAFLQALFDDEGTITTNLSICIHNENLLNQIKRLLEEFNIKTGKITKTLYYSKKGERYRMSFNILTKSYKTFQKEINFFHPDKVERLEFAIKTKNRQLRTRHPSFIEEKIIKILETKPSATMELADELSFTMSGILPHLNKLHKEKMIIKRGYKNKVTWDIS